MFFRKQFHCPDCGSQVGYRSRPRNFTERYFSRIFLLRPVRCGGCFRRSYQPLYIPVKERNEPNPTRPAAA